MAYLVNITVRAGRDLAALYNEIDAENSAAARRWYEQLKAEILRLEKTPACRPVTHESRQLRQLFYGRKPPVYRVIYRVREARKQVDVLHIRHGARRSFKSSTLD
jgi:plasmid stabilization system protein ParE